MKFLCVAIIFCCMLQAVNLSIQNGAVDAKSYYSIGVSNASNRDISRQISYINDILKVKKMNRGKLVLNGYSYDRTDLENITHLDYHRNDLSGPIRVERASIHQIMQNTTEINKEKNTGVDSITDENIGNETEVHFTTIWALCQEFGIATLNCSCDDPNINGLLQMFQIKKTKAFCLLNGTVPEQVEYVLVYNKDLSIAYTSTATIILTIALIGNTMVILVNMKKRSRSRYESLILLLSVCDITFALIQLITVIPTFWTNKWIYDEVSCKILWSLMTLGSIYGIGITMIIAIERYIGVVYPVHYTKAKVIVITSITNVVFGLASVAPLAWNLQVEKHYHICSDEWKSLTAQKIYNGYMLIACTIIPIISVTVLYSLLIHALRSALRTNQCQIKVDSVQYNKRVKQNIRVTNILFVTTIVYAFVITPYRVVKFYLISNKEEVSQNISLYYTLTFAALLPYPIHLAANPIIYSIIDSKWRNDFKMLLKEFSMKLGCKYEKINKSMDTMHTMTTFHTQGTETLD